MIPVALLIGGSSKQVSLDYRSKEYWNTEPHIIDKFTSHPVLEVSDVETFAYVKFRDIDWVPRRYRWAMGYASQFFQVTPFLWRSTQIYSKPEDVALQKRFTNATVLAQHIVANFNSVSFI